jgi:asparagine N-glycosylation enzyme membrane subunit Stt3
MMEWIKNNTKYAFIIPVLVAFTLALLPTLKYQWPLSWDIIYHIQYAKVFAQYGLTFTNPLLNAPLGQKIGYPPLFHLLIVGIGNLFRLDYFQVAKFLQPLLASLIVLSTSYVGYKLYGKIVGLSAGMLMITSILFVRMLFPIPENLALVFLPLAIYLYFNSIEKRTQKTAILAGILLVLMLGIHTAAPLCLFIIITAISLVELIFYRNMSIFKNYASFLLALIISLILGGLFLLLLAPDLLQSILTNGLSGVTGIATSLAQSRPLSLIVYLTTLGVPILIASLIGCVFAIKDYKKRDVFLMVWLISMILLSVSYVVGINVISYRVLIYILIPLSIMGGLGVYGIYKHLKSRPQFSSKNIHNAFLVLVVILCAVNGFLNVNDSEIAIFNVDNELGGIQIAPPSAAEIDLARWFQENGDKNRSLIISNQFSGMFVSTETGMPMNYGFEYYAVKDSPKATFEQVQNEKIGYIVYDKKLVLSPPDNRRLYMRNVPSEFYSLDYFSQDIPSNLNNILPGYAKVVYENQEFIVCEVIIPN